MRTYSPKAGDAVRKWHIIDAQDVVLGRLATHAAVLLRGKHKPTFAPHMDMGDFVIVINAEKIALSGKIVESREKMIELIKVYGMSVSDFLKYFNSAVFKSKHEKLSDILEIIAKYDYRILVGANSEIQLSAMLAELARLEK